jgi:hypothetical protein
MLFGDDNEGYRRLSERLGMPVGSIGPTRRRALARLRDELAGRGHGDFELCSPLRTPPHSALS